MMSEHNSIVELRQDVSIFWPSDFSQETFERNILPILIETQDAFATILSIPMWGITTLFEILNIVIFPSNLFLLHLFVLIDFKGKALHKVYQSWDTLFPTGTMEYKWGAEYRSYRFKTLPVGNAAKPTLLNIRGDVLTQKTKVSDLAQDIIALLLFGGTCPDQRVATVLKKCTLGQYIGDTNRVREFIRQQILDIHRIDLLVSMFGDTHNNKRR
jgi:hypothetical protein